MTRPKNLLCLAGCALLPALAASACATAAGAGDQTAQAQPAHEACTSRNTHAHSRCGFLDRYDTDGDGSVSREEFDAVRLDSFSAKDADGDGVVLEEEYVAEYETRLDRQLAERREAAIRQTYVRFEFLDSDDDERMTQDEFGVSGSRMFGRYDVNGDGRIDDADPSPQSRREQAESHEGSH